MLTFNIQIPCLSALAFSPDNRLLAVAGTTVGGLWHLPSGTPGAELHLPAEDSNIISALRFSADGSRLLVGTRDDCLLFDPAVLTKPVWRAGGGSWKTNWGGLHGLSPDGRHLLLSSGKGEEVVLRLLRWEPGQTPVLVWEQPRPHLAAWGVATPDGRAVTCTFLTNRQKLMLWDETGEIVAEVPATNHIGELHATPDGRHLLALTQQSILIWEDLDITRRPRKCTSNTRQRCNRIAVHPSGQYALLTSNDGSVKVCHLTDRAVVRSYRWDLGPLYTVAVSPDGTLAATGQGRSIIIWDLDL